MAKKAVSKAVLMNCILSIWSFMYWGFSPAQGFNVGLRGTACSVENDPCRSLYEAICDGAHCKCPSGSHEDKNMKRCVKGQAPAGAGAGGDDLFDLPLDYVPGEKPKDKPKPAKEEGTRGGQSPPTGSRDPPRTFGFNVGVRGTSCSLDKYSGSDSCRSLYDAICDGAHCKCPAGSHEDTNLKRCVKGRGGTREDDSFDLPLDYVPGDKPKDKPKTIGGGGGGGQVPSSDPDKSQPYYPSPPAVPRPHHPQPQTPKEGGYTYNGGNVDINHSEGYPRQPHVGNPNHSDGDPKHPLGYPQQSGGHPHQPDEYPQPGYPQQGDGHPHHPVVDVQPGYPQQPHHSEWDPQPEYPKQPHYSRGDSRPRYPEQPHYSEWDPQPGYPKQPHYSEGDPQPGYPKQPHYSEGDPHPRYPQQPHHTYPLPEHTQQPHHTYPLPEHPQQPHHSYPLPEHPQLPHHPEGYPQPEYPGKYPTQPESYPKKPGSPDNYPPHPRITDHVQNGGSSGDGFVTLQDHGEQTSYSGDPHIGEKAGGGVGGGIGLLLLIGLVYFCCCRGEKGKNLLSKLPFGGGGQNEQSTTYAMQQQQTHVDPGQNPGTPPPADASGDDYPDVSPALPGQLPQYPVYPPSAPPVSQ